MALSSCDALPMNTSSDRQARGASSALVRFTLAGPDLSIRTQGRSGGPAFTQPDIPIDAFGCPTFLPVVLFEKFEPQIR